MTATVPERRADGLTRAAQRARKQWLAMAACQDSDPEMFFDDENPDPALAVCAGCPVRAQCLEEVMDQERGKGTTPEGNLKYRHGVRGGLDGHGRWALEFPEEAGITSS